MNGKIGLVLAGGGGKGAYQIGVWKALIEFGINKNIGAISGTSVGALNATLLLQGNYNIAEELWSNIKPQQILSADLNRFYKTILSIGVHGKLIEPIYFWIEKASMHGAFSRKGLIEMIDNYVNLELISHVPIPCYATCCKIPLLQAKYFKLNNQKKDTIVDILLASSAIPTIFEPVKINDNIYIDGGLLDNIPIQPLYDEGYKTIIVVHLGRTNIIDSKKFPGAKIYEIFPKIELGNILTGTLDFTKEGAQKRIKQGYEETVSILKPVLETFLIQNQINNTISKINDNNRIFTEKRKSRLEEKEAIIKKLNHNSNDQIHLDLQLQVIQDLTYEEKKELDKNIDYILPKIKTNSNAIIRYTLDSVFHLNPCEARINELAEQGLIGRILGKITGKNSQMQLEINKDFVKLQYTAQKLIQKLQEQNLLSFEIINIVQNRLNTSMIEFSEDVNILLRNFFKASSEKIRCLERRIDKVEEDTSILKWQTNIRNEMLEGKDYIKLNIIEKIICVTSDFFKLSQGKWDINAMKILKTTYHNLEISYEKKIKLNEFINLRDRQVILKKLFESINKSNLKKFSAYEMPIFYIIESNPEKEVALCANNYEKGDIANYLSRSAFIDIDKKISILEITLELLFELKCLKEADCIKFNEIHDINLIKGEEHYFKGEYNNALEYLEKAIKNANSKAMYYYGDIIKNGYGNIEKKEDMAYEYFKKGAELDSPFCQYALALYLNDKETSDLLFKKSFENLKQLAEEDDIEAQFIVSQMFYYGYGKEIDDKEFKNWIEKAANQGHINAQYHLGDVYYYGYGVVKDEKKAREWFRKAANQGHKNAQYHLGDIYYNGYGVEKDEVVAMEWFRKAAEAGHIISQYRLGDMFYKGCGVKKDKAEAINWMRMAADQDHLEAQYHLGVIYNNCYGIIKDFESAEKWFRKAAKQGYPDAQENLGKMYYFGVGLEQDYEKAERWFGMVVEKDFPDAQYYLGNIYYHHYYGKKDNEAEKMFRKAAMQGHPLAQYQLGVMYYNGYGVEKNEERAKEWFGKAADQGHPDAINALDMEKYNRRSIYDVFCK